MIFFFEIWIMSSQTLCEMCPWNSLYIPKVKPEDTKPGSQFFQTVTQSHHAIRAVHGDCESI